MYHGPPISTPLATLSPNTTLFPSLGGRISADVSTEFQRPLEGRACKGIVDHDERPGIMRNVAHRLHIDDVEGGVCRCFKEEPLGVRPQSRLPCGVVAAIDDRCFDPEFGQPRVG